MSDRHMPCALTASAVCGVSALQLSDGFSVRVAPAAAVEEGDCVREVVEARAAPAAHVAHSVVQEAAVRPGAYHQLTACAGDQSCLNPPSEKPA